MFFLNLTAAEFMTLLGGLSSLIAVLYLLDQSRRKKVVSTLRFWTPAASARASQPRRRVRDPWSLVLQLAGLLLLLLAIAQLQWGTRQRSGRDHVILLDTSAWSAQRMPTGTLLDLEKRAVEEYLSARAPADRIMLVRADALAAPVTPFTSDQAQLAQALRLTRPGHSALNIEQALKFAQQAQGWSGGERGEVVYIGPGMIPESDVQPPQLPNLRVIRIGRAVEHVGIRGVGVKPSDTAENGWEASVTIRNYGVRRAVLTLRTRFAGTMFAPRLLSLEPGAESIVEYTFVTNTGGQLIAELDAAAGDEMNDRRVALELPRVGVLRAAIFTDRPEVFKPLFSANNRLNVRFFPASASATDLSTDVMILDRTSRAVPPTVAAIWIDPPRDASPLPVTAVVANGAIREWHSETPLGESLRATDTRLGSAEVFQTFDGDMTLGSSAEGPIVVARGATRTRGKFAVIGFDPLNGEARLELTTPLLFANLLRWISPDVFRSIGFSAEQIGELAITLEPGERADRVHIFDQRGRPVPFVVRKQTLQLFTSAPEMFRIASEGRDRIVSATLPDVAAFEWKTPAHTSAGLPRRVTFAPAPVDLWRWLSVLGGFILLLEWILYGRSRTLKRSGAPIEPPPTPVAHPSVVPETELVAK